MDARTFRHCLWAVPMVLASSAFYSVMLVAGLKLIFAVDEVYLKAAGLGAFVVFCVLGGCYFAPKLKRNEFDEIPNERYTSVWGARVAIVVGAWIGTVLSVPAIDNIGFLNAMPRWVAVSALFVFFATVVFIFSHFVWQPGRRR